MRCAFFTAALLTLAGCNNSNEPVDADADTAIARGEARYVTCQGCHGNDGEGLAGMNAPRLAGLSADYIERQLMNYRSGIRGGPDDFYGVAMNGRAKALGGDGAVHDVAVYLATLPEPSAPLSADEADAQVLALGASLYETCAACHGAAGEGNEALKAPALAGTDPAYLARQLNNFRSGVRGREGDPEGEQMRAAAQVLPDEAAVEAVALHAASLR
ncbi:c-type cytochrome [Croceicoccus sediminis]|uniref:c-type cytochrome n=1 Tax=Croceicoccus sediminis TaxID=2571150 RepID=UPI001182F86F|nr:c-type cytochrome [Croceicoccus sediminis]